VCHGDRQPDSLRIGIRGLLAVPQGNGDIAPLACAGSRDGGVCGAQLDWHEGFPYLFGHHQIFFVRRLTEGVLRQSDVVRNRVGGSLCYL